jgi:hypothetical protein
MGRPFIVDLQNDSTRKLKTTLAKVGAELWEREYGTKAKPTAKPTTDVPLPNAVNA